MQNFNAKSKTDLAVRCYRFSLAVLALVDQFPSSRSSNILVNQLVRAATSIGANLVEARAASSRLEFKKFNEISLKSANETKYWLGLLRDSKIGNEMAINNLLAETHEIANMLAAGILKLKKH